MALEGEGGHGVFTFALLEGLRGAGDRNKNGKIEVGELADYIEETMPSHHEAKVALRAAPVPGYAGSFLFRSADALTMSQSVVPPLKPLKLFISYAHDDDDLRSVLLDHLAQLRRDGLIEAWHDRQLTGGAEWADQIDENLEAADIILLLVSASFLASEYCNDKEMARGLERHEAGQARVIPVILRPCDWHTAKFGKLQAFPTDGKPIVEWQPIDKGYLEVAQGLRKVIAELHGSTAAPAANAEAAKLRHGSAPDASALVGSGCRCFGGDVRARGLLVVGGKQIGNSKRGRRRCSSNSSSPKARRRGIRQGARFAARAGPERSRPGHAGWRSVLPQKQARRSKGPLREVVRARSKRPRLTSASVC